MKLIEPTLFLALPYGEVYHFVDDDTSQTFCGMKVLRGHRFEWLTRRRMDRRLCRRCSRARDRLELIEALFEKGEQC